ncbi:MAG TPA: hypothetical protein VFX61_13265 [Micromonosporaceae bacterium]|nr:hypothetical protein [Micromonosporaceae bacterium]
MSENPPNPEVQLQQTAEQMAAAHTAASSDLEAFLRRTPPVPTPADIAEFANLVAREHAIRIDRDMAMQALGLRAPSIEPE